MSNIGLALPGSIVFTRTDGTLYSVGQDLSDSSLLSDRKDTPFCQNLLPSPIATANSQHTKAKEAFYKSLIIVDQEVEEELDGEAKFLATNFCSVSA